MANRQRFSRAAQREIARRAVNAVGVPACERCGAVGVPLDLHHVTQDAMKTAEAKKRKLTADDGMMLCKAVCHKAESAAQKPILAKTERQEAAYLLPRKRGRGWREPAPKDRSVTKLVGRRPLYEDA